MKSLRIAALGLSALMMVSLAGSAFAGPFGKVTNHREYRQEHRIHQGVRSGQLTRQEAFKLAKGQRQIDRYEHVARADGKITPKEFHRLDNMQDRQNRAIFRQKHDGQSRRY